MRKKGGLDNSSLDLTLGAVSSFLVCVGQAVSICTVSLCFLERGKISF